MIGRGVELYHQYYDQLMAWYNGADILTQYVVVAASFVAFFLFSTMMYLSRLTKCK